MSVARLSEPPTLEERVVRIEGLLGLKPDLRFVAGSEFWIVQADGNREERGLNYWGPFPSPEAAQENDLFRPQFGCIVVEVPT